MLSDPDFIFGLVGALGVLIPLLGTPLAVVWRWCRTTTRLLETFLDDWNGEPPRPGVLARAGVMERLAALEAATAQLTRNGGDHLADKIEQIAANQAMKTAQMVRIENALAAVTSALQVGEHRFERIDRALDHLSESEDAV